MSDQEVQGPQESRIIHMETRINSHIEEYNLHIIDATNREAALLKATEDNAKAIGALTISTQGLVDGWLALNAFQRFIKWASAFTLVAAFMAWLSKELL